MCVIQEGNTNYNQGGLLHGHLYLVETDKKSMDGMEEDKLRRSTQIDL